MYRRIAKLSYRGELVLLIYLIFALIGAVSIFFAAYLVIEEIVEIAGGTRGFSYPALNTIVEFGWPFAMGLGIWLAGAAVRLLLTGERAFPLRLGSVPPKTIPDEDVGDWGNDWRRTEKAPRAMRRG